MKIKTVSTANELKNILAVFRSASKTIGFVPTMGALHKGHISLINSAKANCDIVVASIFVNPTQFNNADDLTNYPRTLETDSQLLEDAGCDFVFVPDVSEMYSSKELELKKQNIEDASWMNGKAVDFGELATVMEGAHRPGHFNGVAQVVSKLFRIVKPNKAFFGQKDFQQLAIIRSMCEQLEMPIEIVGCPIVREESGLAMSSRNARLSEAERQTATVISATLKKIQALKKIKTAEEVRQLAIAQLKSEKNIQLEYLELANADTLQSIKNFSDAKAIVACVALQLGSVRLIDNVLV